MTSNNRNRRKGRSDNAQTKKAKLAGRTEEKALNREAAHVETEEEEGKKEFARENP